VWKRERRSFLPDEDQEGGKSFTQKERAEKVLERREKRIRRNKQLKNKKKGSLPGRMKEEKARVLRQWKSGEKKR